MSSYPSSRVCVFFIRPVFRNATRLLIELCLNFRESLIDKRIESAVCQMQSVIELGRVIRDRKTLPVKVRRDYPTSPPALLSAASTTPVHPGEKWHDGSCRARRKWSCQREDGFITVLLCSRGPLRISLSVFPTLFSLFRIPSFDVCPVWYGRCWEMLWKWHKEPHPCCTFLWMLLLEITAKMFWVFLVSPEGGGGYPSGPRGSERHPGLAEVHSGGEWC